MTKECDSENKIEKNKGEYQENLNESLGKRWEKKSRLVGQVILFITLGAIMFEFRPRWNDVGACWLYLVFFSIPFTLLGGLERIWIWLKFDIEFRRVIYCIIVISSVGLWSGFLIDKFQSKNRKVDVSITSPTYAPMKIENKQINDGNRSL